MSMPKAIHSLNKRKTCRTSIQQSPTGHRRFNNLPIGRKKTSSSSSSSINTSSIKPTNTCTAFNTVPNEIFIEYLLPCFFLLDIFKIRACTNLKLICDQLIIQNRIPLRVPEDINSFYLAVHIVETYLIPFREANRQAENGGEQKTETITTTPVDILIGDGEYEVCADFYDYAIITQSMRIKGSGMKRTILQGKLDVQAGTVGSDGVLTQKIIMEDFSLTNCVRDVLVRKCHWHIQSPFGPQNKNHQHHQYQLPKLGLYAHQSKMCDGSVRVSSYTNEHNWEVKDGGGGITIKGSSYHHDSINKRSLKALLIRCEVYSCNKMYNEYYDHLGSDGGDTCTGITCSQAKIDMIDCVIRDNKGTGVSISSVTGPCKFVNLKCVGNMFNGLEFNGNHWKQDSEHHSLDLTGHKTEIQNNGIAKGCYDGHPAMGGHSEADWGSVDEYGREDMYGKPYNYESWFVKFYGIKVQGYGTTPQQHGTSPFLEWNSKNRRQPVIRIHKPLTLDSVSFGNHNSQNFKEQYAGKITLVE